MFRNSMGSPLVMLKALPGAFSAVMDSSQASATFSTLVRSTRLRPSRKRGIPVLALAVRILGTRLVSPMPISPRGLRITVSRPFFSHFRRIASAMSLDLM